MIRKKTEIAFESVFSGYLNEYVSLKRSLGFKFETEAGILKRLDRYCIAKGVSELGLSRNVIDEWARYKEREAPQTYINRLNVTRGFLQHLLNRGVPAAMPLDNRTVNHTYTFVPYIYTHEQISLLLRTADALPRPGRQSQFHIIFPAILRVMYGCGLRVSEALVLKIDDVDFCDNTLTVWNSKNNNCRKIPFSTSLALALADYKKKIHINPHANDFFFPNAKGEQYSQRTVYDKFREILCLCGIPHTGHGPRVHDLRHSFAVHSLQKMVEQKHDTYVALPILAVYLGHSRLISTEKYLHLTAEMYPDILEKTRYIADRVIPEVALL